MLVLFEFFWDKVEWYSIIATTDAIEYSNMDVATGVKRFRGSERNSARSDCMPILLLVSLELVLLPGIVSSLVFVYTLSVEFKVDVKVEAKVEVIVE